MKTNLLLTLMHDGVNKFMKYKVDVFCYSFTLRTVIGEGEFYFLKKTHG